MANEIHADCAAGNTLYAVIRNSAGQAWHVAGRAFEDWGSGGHTADDYDIGLVDEGGSHYVGHFDVHIPAGSYRIQVFLRAGALPVDTDPLVLSREFVWTATGELTAVKLLANRAVQDKVTGAINYYDDDSQTVLLTHLADDTASTLTRTPD